MHGRELLHDLSTVDKLLEAIFGVHIESSTMEDLQEKRFDPIRGPLAEIAQTAVVSRGPLSTPRETGCPPFQDSAGSVPSFGHSVEGRAGADLALSLAFFTSKPASHTRLRASCRLQQPTCLLIFFWDNNTIKGRGMTLFISKSC